MEVSIALVSDKTGFNLHIVDKSLRLYGGKVHKKDLKSYGVNFSKSEDRKDSDDNYKSEQISAGTGNEEDSDDDDTDENEKMPMSKRKKGSMVRGSLTVLSDISSMSLKAGKFGLKSMVDIFSNKHVSRGQIIGKWKFMQDINVSDGVIINFPATIQFLRDGSVKTNFEGKEFTSKFEFTENKWPRKCLIKFDAQACILEGHDEPVSLSYVGYFKRSIMKPKLILMRGKIYRTSGKGL